MRDGFVAGKFKRAGEGAGGMDGCVFHDGMSWRKFSTGGIGVAGTEEARREGRKKDNAEAQSSQRSAEEERGGRFLRLRDLTRQSAARRRKSGHRTGDDRLGGRYEDPGERPQGSRQKAAGW
jgi:hypothetical protein